MGITPKKSQCHSTPIWQSLRIEYVRPSVCGLGDEISCPEIVVEEPIRNGFQIYSFVVPYKMESWVLWDDDGAQFECMLMKRLYAPCFWCDKPEFLIYLINNWSWELFVDVLLNDFVCQQGKMLVWNHFGVICWKNKLVLLFEWC